MPPKLSAGEIRSLFRYEPETGNLIRLISMGRDAESGRVAGTVGAAGYVFIKIRYHRYRAHRLAFVWMTGEWPQHEIDHINGDRADNRWVNLRPATSQQNRRNQRRRRDNTSGFKGVCWDKNRRLWQASITVNYRPTYLGHFDDPLKAYEAYLAAAKEHFGEFARAA